MDVAIARYCNSPAVRLAGCLLLILVILSHGPFMLLQPASLPVTVLRLLVLSFILLLYGINSYPATFLNASYALWRQIQPWNQVLDLWTRTIIITVSNYVALPELTKDIVFAYSIGILFDGHDNRYLFAWAVSLLGNHCLSMSVGMMISKKLSLYRYITLSVISFVCLSVSIRNFGYVYTFTVLVYHCLIHEWIVNSFIVAVKSIDLDCFEGLEKFYVWIMAFVLQFLLGSSHAFLLLMNVDCHFLTVTLFAPVVLLCYIVCYPALSGLVKSCTILHQYMRRLSFFPVASSEQIEEMRSDVCAVCLCTMSQARKTPCNHYFHGKCLIRCLRHRATCPMCKTAFDIRIPR